MGPRIAPKTWPICQFEKVSISEKQDIISRLCSLDSRDQHRRRKNQVYKEVDKVKMCQRYSGIFRFCELL